MSFRIAPLPVPLPSPLSWGEGIGRLSRIVAVSTCNGRSGSFFMPPTEPDEEEHEKTHAQDGGDGPGGGVSMAGKHAQRAEAHGRTRANAKTDDGLVDSAAAFAARCA